MSAQSAYDPATGYSVDDNATCCEDCERRGTQRKSRKRALFITPFSEQNKHIG